MMRKNRRGYILIAVLGLATIVTALGLSFLDSHSTAMPSAVNYQRAVRAQYLAESGVALASHFLMYPPANVTFNDYYRGGSGIAIDATSDYTDVTVARSDTWVPAGTDPNLYRITAVGVARDPDGTVRGKRSVTTDVLVAPAKWEIPYALFNRNSLTVVSPVRLLGDVHANGLLTGNLGSYCNGKVTATGTALWLGGGPPSAVLSLQPSYTGPVGTLSKYTNYTIQGKSYSAHTTYTRNEINASDAVTLNAIDMSATNPGRIIVCKNGNFKLRVNADVNGTLLVNGNLEIDDAGAHIVRGVDGFPAIIVTGNIDYLDDDASLTVTGSIICGGAIDLNLVRRGILNVTGSVIAANGIVDVRGDSTIQCTWSASRSSFWDVESTPTPQPITVLSWKED
ncbi:MAG: hypothetical protein DCC65_09635 [Planctomycetota bacterium]|nr:MAG: hypothetical protein DCC65_09635 [Planctomycetota bacterium]